MHITHLSFPSLLPYPTRTRLYTKSWKEKESSCKEKKEREKMVYVCSQKGRKGDANQNIKIKAWGVETKAETTKLKWYVHIVGVKRSVSTDGVKPIKSGVCALDWRRPCCKCLD
jgi:hypothetical protein